MGLSIIPLGFDDGVFDDPSLACFGYPTFMTLGWCFAFAALFAKTRLVNRVFHKPAFTVLRVGKADVVWPIVLMVGGKWIVVTLSLESLSHIICPCWFFTANAAVLAIWAFLDPFRYGRYVLTVDKFDRTKTSSGFCESEHSRLFWTICAVLNIGVLVVAFQQAYVARKIATEFAESEYIFQTMCTILVVAFVALPVMVIVENDPRAIYFVKTAFSFVVSMSLLLFLFIPKIFYFHRFGNDNYTTAVRDSLRRLRKQGIDGGPVGLESESDLGSLVVDHPKLRLRQYCEIHYLLNKVQHLEDQLSELNPDATSRTVELSLPETTDGGKLPRECPLPPQKLPSHEEFRDYLKSLYG